ncbi:phosphoribosylformimino-5-aminoimidazole carboxamide ribotide isomerase [Aequitasia blattaphilus]|uniref:Phosphoribosylformimino-5-aminoimidazole carboxamide ribotide isomerase n=1 Tax=Aequitasia blattaphilus TaxID=2949332 RepID=A0ABT1E6V3_9FIRM|nr:phosphoribosylformimino-5-aminoimidazole carboxamide ribotide isomerase [Aequitasia blattaphilus]MCP1101441.1 phosphoribosylformimino-5-aminoimidazole carboxamide ribotide isomerase [Aequitasia blattaphilus]MCR8614081.1 phosphoribosylformimino-5-aminoimidazole carboxamide ribotide isomerase [Aequitasia blattaphilus]
MKFRPCIDIHNGQVKQIVGGSLKEQSEAKVNFASDKSAAYYGKLYKESNLKGGHVIMLNGTDSPYFEETKRQALEALAADKGSLQIGGGITTENAAFYLESGASHVIVTSYVFQDGRIHYERLAELKDEIGREHLVLDLSCRKKDGHYHIVTNRWQRFTDEIVTKELLVRLSEYCDEFLIHGVDVEGTGVGMEKELVKLLSSYDGIPMTYAGGMKSVEDIEEFGCLTEKKMDFTIGSALDIFGGDLPYEFVKGMS